MGNIFKHYKGGLYNVIGTGTHTETGEQCAIYEDQVGQVWIRPVDMFRGKVEVDGKEINRFERVGYFRRGPIT